jgi:thiol-disulfide isomerase/thioredoxin
MSFIKKHFWNIVFFGFIIFMFTPYGLPVRTTLIKGVAFVTSRVFSPEIDQAERVKLSTYDWQLMSLQKKAVNLKSFKDKVVVVNFWATWCPPCIAEMPSFEKLYSNYKKDVVFLFVANDDKDKVEKFMEKNKYEIPVYFMTSENPSELESNSLPTTYIINKNGEIVVEKVGAADWNSGKIHEILDAALK